MHRCFPTPPPRQYNPIQKSGRSLFFVVPSCVIKPKNDADPPSDGHPTRRSRVHNEVCSTSPSGVVRKVALPLRRTTKVSGYSLTSRRGLPRFLVPQPTTAAPSGASLRAQQSRGSSPACIPLPFGQELRKPVNPVDNESCHTGASNDA